MAKLSQKQLEEMAKNRKSENNNNLNEKKIDSESLNKSSKSISHSKMINDILGDEGVQLYKYTLPDGAIKNNKNGKIPNVNIQDYPPLNITGKASRSRQSKPVNFYALEEIDYILKNISSGNKNATLNFLVWVGLQALKGMSHSIDIKVHDDTYADGALIKEYLKEDI